MWLNHLDHHGEKCKPSQKLRIISGPCPDLPALYVVLMLKWKCVQSFFTYLMLDGTIFFKGLRILTSGSPMSNCPSIKKVACFPTGTLSKPSPLRFTFAASTTLHWNGLPGTFSPLNFSSTMWGFASFGIKEMAYVWLPWAWALVGTWPLLTEKQL